MEKSRVITLAVAAFGVLLVVIAHKLLRDRRQVVPQSSVAFAH